MARPRKDKTIEEKQPELTQEPIKMQMVKQEETAKIQSLKAKIDIAVIQRKFGCIPSVVYLGKKRLEINGEELLDTNSDKYRLLKQEGLVSEV